MGLSLGGNMNDLIKELSEESGITQYIAANNKYLERFAELIIKECCSTVNENSERFILKRFGIEYKPRMRKHDNYSDIFTIEEFENDRSMGALISDDGSGYWSTETERSNISVWSYEKPEWATHVAWYNR